MAKPPVVGLTGGIASGKSTVSSLLSTHHIPIIDADILAREVVAPNTSGFQLIVNHFGPDRILNSQGQLDRVALGEIVFHDEDERKWLNGVIHPRVRKSIVWKVLKCWLKGEWCVVLDVPLLIEAGLWRWVGEVVVVFVNDKLQISRLLSRPSPTPLSITQAQARISSQMPLSQKAIYATCIIDNSGSLPELATQVDRLISKWKKQQGGETGWWWRLCRIPPIGLTAGVVCLVRRWIMMRKGRRRGRGEVLRFVHDDEREQVELRDMRRRTGSGGDLSVES
ncbi:hypothetical protein TREMEDRAFT_27919 [Tremella mesenterica DSM 1558]|uniref:uncharacterized protein n=1 Tax=Tremella mesenterica (strain ATCC 24925 / CBS 8224 / DSM 1558 / NBRC 9311 / NRRL Y-6157 / RJB 2259-6 / UBC 559-6) TaxID=578456 RepID=UPI0003F492EB|nr:uncharacterized protein TREMEDRAFT_27919 [Tremella mesenterica DSM 1558]EIW71761.1 hypothetical protein TREMEDRAFT_27919 [Tremella mesenterica DSM 1558]